MIVRIYPYNGREDRIKHYSDAKLLIKQNETGTLYTEAIDVYPCRYTYSESDEPIPTQDSETETEVDDNGTVS